MPQLSKSACTANQRISPLDNVNMNRAFPGQSPRNHFVPHCDFVKSYVFPRVRVVVDMHAGWPRGRLRALHLVSSRA